MTQGRHSELLVIQRVYDLLLWLLPQIERFPRSQRFALGARIEADLFALLDGLIAAKYAGKAKRRHLAHGSSRLVRLRYLLRLGFVLPARKAAGGNAQRPARALLGLVLIAGAGAAAVAAQTVTSVSGDAVTLSLGATAGMRAGMTGKLCGMERVGEEEVEVCPATFEVLRVRETSSTARVVEGEGEVTVGLTATFDQRLVPPRAAPSPPASQALPADPLKLLAAGHATNRCADRLERNTPECGR